MKMELRRADDIGKAAVELIEIKTKKLGINIPCYGVHQSDVALNELDMIIKQLHETYRIVTIKFITDEFNVVDAAPEFCGSIITGTVQIDYTEVINL